MFGTGKINVEPKKARKKHGLPFFIIGTFTFAIEAMLGINAAFLVDQSITVVVRNMLSGTALVPLGAIISLVVSLAVGFSFIFGGMWIFAGFMDSLEDARAYRDTYGTRNWPVVMVWALMSAVIALDFTTLMFRASFFAEKGATALFWFFIILILLPPMLGPLIHVLEHTPRDRRLTKARQHAEALETDDIERVVETMDPDLRSRWLSGDPVALGEHYERVEEMRADAAAYEQQKIAEREAKRNKVNQPLPTGGNSHPKRLAVLPQQASQGGSQSQRA